MPPQTLTTALSSFLMHATSAIFLDLPATSRS